MEEIGIHVSVRRSLVIEILQLPSAGTKPEQTPTVQVISTPSPFYVLRYESAIS